MSNPFIETCKSKLKIWAGAIGANGDAEDMKAAAIVAQKRVDDALKFGSLLQNGNNSDAYKKLMDASGYLSKIIEFYEKGGKIYKDFKAVQQIFEAIQVLSDDNIMTNDSAAAAKAFDNLFIGFGTLAKHFPPPFDSTIGEFLIQCGTLSFFSNMRETMVGNNSNLGRAMFLRDNMTDR